MFSVTCRKTVFLSGSPLTSVLVTVQFDKVKVNSVTVYSENHTDCPMIYLLNIGGGLRIEV